MISGASVGDVIVITAYEIGGGNQLYLNTYLGSELAGGNTIVVPFAQDAIYQFAIYNGEIPLFDGSDYTWTAGTIPNTTVITFTETYDATNRINLCALGYASVGATHSWSCPVFQTFIADGSLTYDLVDWASLQGTNIPIKMMKTCLRYK